jgi:hypothetical protein
VITYTITVEIEPLCSVVLNELKMNFVCFPQKWNHIRFALDLSLLITFYSAIPVTSTDKCIVEATRDSYCHSLSH